MKIYKLGLLLLVILSFTHQSCKQEISQTTYSGHIIDDATRLGINRCIVVWRQGPDRFGQPVYVDSMMTNEKGYYHSRFNECKNMFSSMTAFHPNYFLGIFTTLSHHEPHQDEIYKLMSKATFTLNLINSKGGNKIAVKTFQKDEYLYHGIDSMIAINGNQTFSHTVIGGRYIKLNYEITEMNANKTVTEDSVLCPQFKETNFTINY
ncbi:MAG: hypothetical protein HYZ42_01100 [Bacteroidetes bacterium]|nr:hypothetical protein [Bacteroidota bacterium]